MVRWCSLRDTACCVCVRDREQCQHRQGRVSFPAHRHLYMDRGKRRACAESTPHAMLHAHSHPPQATCGVELLRCPHSPARRGRIAVVRWCVPARSAYTAARPTGVKREGERIHAVCIFLYINGICRHYVLCRSLTSFVFRIPGWRTR